MKENQTNLENKVLMTKLQKIFLPDPKMKIDVSISSQENFVKGRTRTLKNHVRNKQVSIAIENERIRKRLCDKKSIYNFNNTSTFNHKSIFSPSKIQNLTFGIIGRRNVNGSFLDTVDYGNSNQLSKSFNNDILFNNTMVDDSNCGLLDSTNRDDPNNCIYFFVAKIW